jgi:hypothetical protein
MTTRTRKRIEFRPDDDTLAWLEQRADLQGINVQTELGNLLRHLKRQDMRNGFWRIRHGL